LPWGRPPARAGLQEYTVPLWHARWALLLASALGLLAAGGASLLRPIQFTAHASFVVQPGQRSSLGPTAAAIPSLSGLVGGGINPVDLHLAVLQSEAVADRIIERFGLRQAWQVPFQVHARQRLARRVVLQSARRDGVVGVLVQDENPQRAAAIANQYIEELRSLLRQFALDEARQRRSFYDAQLARARAGLEEAQRALQSSGYDRAALRAEPRAAAEAYGRMQAEVTAAEVRLAATRRVRTETSAEVLQQLAELAAQRAQLQRMEAPREDGQGAFVGRLRAFRYAEALVESLSRQAETARVEEASDPISLPQLDRALVPELPSGPRPLMWALAGAAAGFAAMAAWVLLQHNAAMAWHDPARQLRLAQIRAALPPRRHWWGGRRQAPGP
jgi:uncharacterized protein involved in exopolysaccharide biosynthesis